MKPWFVWVARAWHTLIHTVILLCVVSLAFALARIQIEGEDVVDHLHGILSRSEWIFVVAACALLGIVWRLAEERKEALKKEIKAVDEKRIAAYRDDNAALRDDLTDLRACINEHEPWIWIGDPEEDDLDSMSGLMVVQITARQLREFIREGRR